MYYNLKKSIIIASRTKNPYELSFTDLFPWQKSSKIAGRPCMKKKNGTKFRCQFGSSLAKEITGNWCHFTILPSGVVNVANIEEVEKISMILSYCQFDTGSTAYVVTHSGEFNAQNLLEKCVFLKMSKENRSRYFLSRWWSIMRQSTRESAHCVTDVATIKTAKEVKTQTSDTT
jgi:hypothetical protein